MNELPREELILLQFQHNDLNVTVNMQPSLNRICSFLIEQTNLYYLNFITEDILIRYLKFHRAHNYEKVSFKQAIKDVKNFLFFLKNCKNIKHPPEIDLSIQNTSLWSDL